LIEIGRDSGLSLATRRIAGTLTGISAILALIWIIRGPLGIQQYSLSVLLAGFSLGFLGRVFHTETISGAGRALVSFLWNLTWAFVGIILGIWILGWVASLQSDVLPSRRPPICHLKLDPQSYSCGDRCWSRSIRHAKARPGAEVESDSIHRHRGQRANNGRNQTNREA